MNTEVITAEIVTDEGTLTTAAVEIDAINRFHRAATNAANAARAKAEEASHYAILCGTRLEALKNSLPHGEWGRIFSPRQIGTKLESGSDLVLEFSIRTADKYIEVAKRIRAEQSLSGKAQKRIAALAAEPEIDDDGRDFLSKITAGRNLRQLYFDLEILQAPDKEPKAAKDPGPVLPPKSEAQRRLEDAREWWGTWREQGEKLIRMGSLDHLDQKGLEEMKEFQGWLRDRINARLKTL
jgi:hypothetical protein